MKADLRNPTLREHCRETLAINIREYRATPTSQNFEQVRFALGAFPEKHNRTVDLLHSWLSRQVRLRPTTMVRRTLSALGARNALAKRIRRYRSDWKNYWTAWKRIEQALAYFPDKKAQRIRRLLYHWLCRIDPFEGKPVTLTAPKITREELGALLGIFAENGRYWKAVIMNKWRTNTGSPTLLRLRDADYFGLKVLEKVRLGDLYQVRDYYIKHPSAGW